MSVPSPVNFFNCLLNLAYARVCVHVCGGKGTHPGRCCSSWRWSLVGVGPAGWNGTRTSTEWCFSPACWLSPFQPCFPKAGSKGRGGTRRGIRHKKERSLTVKRTARDASPTHLVVYLQLLQCGVVLQSFDQGQDSCSCDEVGLHVQAFQSRVHFQHLCQSLKKNQPKLSQ